MVSSDGPGEYAVVGESRAGYMDDMQLTAGQVAYITTGKCSRHRQQPPDSPQHVHRARTGAAGSCWGSRAYVPVSTAVAFSSVC